MFIFLLKSKWSKFQDIPELLIIWASPIYSLGFPDPNDNVANNTVHILILVLGCRTSLNLLVYSMLIIYIYICMSILIQMTIKFIYI